MDEIRKITYNNTVIEAKGVILNYTFYGEFIYNNKEYIAAFPLTGCEVGDHDVVPILGYENSIIGEECRQCGIKL